LPSLLLIIGPELHLAFAAVAPSLLEETSQVRPEMLAAEQRVLAAGQNVNQKSACQGRLQSPHYQRQEQPDRVERRYVEE
jgi:hypothetical protein